MIYMIEHLHPAGPVLIDREISIADLQAGDVFQDAYTIYRVIAIQDARHGFTLDLVRLSDGWQGRSHSLYMPKVVTLLHRGK